MAIIRIKKEREYVSIANAILQDKVLSWEARGIMAYLLSKPDGWECRNYDLVNHGPASEHVVKRVMKELQEAGYINRRRVSQGRGKIEWVTEIYESAAANPNFTKGDFSTIESFEIESFEDEKSPHIVSTDNSNNRLSVNKDLIPQKSKNGFDRTEQTERDNLNALADQIAGVCQIDIDTASEQRRKELKRVTLALYGKSIKPEDLKSFSNWWYHNNWMGKKGQAPTPAQVGDNWGQFESDQNGKQMNGHTYNPDLTPEQLAALKEFQAANQIK